MTWRKLGRVFNASGERTWMRTHAANPLPERVEGSIYRIYFNSRDGRNRSHVAWLVVDLERPQEILELSPVPAMEPGPAGGFDESGVSLGCLVRQGSETLLYYVGWDLRIAPWRNTIGLATKRIDPETRAIRFDRQGTGPILDLDAGDPYNLSYPWVIVEDGRWRMWYGSNLAPTPPDLLNIPHACKSAGSHDGIHWDRHPEPLCLGGALIGDCAFSRPCVVHDPDRFRMWYCHRGEVYQLGYAESDDGLTWTRRDDEVGIASSAGADAWDSESLCYPCVFDHDGTRFLLYNGRRYGATGFGLAISER